MTSWGELYDQKESLSLKVNELGIDTEKRSIQKLVSGSQDVMDLEMRADAVLHGAIASDAGVGAAHKKMNDHHFPHLVSGGYLRDGVTASAEEFSNDCHDDQGRFCEGTGGSHATPMQTMLHDVWTSPEHRRALTTNKQSAPSGADDGPRISIPSKEIVEREAKKRAIEKSAQEVDKAYHTPNAWGFSEADLDAEKKAIIKQFKRGEHGILNPMSRGWLDRVDGETRAQAVSQGRVANKGEIKRGRDKATSANWGGLIALGLLLK